MVRQKGRLGITKMGYLLTTFWILSCALVSSASAGGKQLQALNLHAVIFEMPAATAKHANEIAESAQDVSDGEFMHIKENDQRYLMLAVPAKPMPKQKFIDEYHRLEVLVDGKIQIKLSDYPRFFSHALNDPSIIRGVPTIVPLDVLPEGFMGEAHDFELLRDGKRIYGPIRWLVRDKRSGPIAHSVTGGPGKGEVVFEFSKIDFKLSAAVMYMDDLFGEPSKVEQVLPDGSTSPLKFRYVGIDMIGDQPIFREAYVEGFHAGFSKELKIRMVFPESGTGYVAVVGQMYTSFDANRTITVP